MRIEESLVLPRLGDLTLSRLAPRLKWGYSTRVGRRVGGEIVLAVKPPVTSVLPTMLSVLATIMVQAAVVLVPA